MVVAVGSPLILVPCVFTIVTACTFQFVGPVYFLKTFQNFTSGVAIWLVLGWRYLSVRARLGLRLGLPFVFTMFVPSLLHSHPALLSHGKRWSNKVSNVNIHGWFCSHYLFQHFCFRG